MTFHTTRLKRLAKGTARTNDEGHGLTPRISVGFEERDWKRITWLAAQQQVPVASIIRDAVYAYCLCIAPEADAAHPNQEAVA